MGYAFDVSERVPDAVQRVVEEQVKRAVSTLEQADARDLEAAVHDCRKRGKKLRALMRLVRPAFGSAYRPANDAFRDAGRELSPLRDAHAALATFDALIAASPDRLPAGGLGAVRSGLAALAEEATHARDRRPRAERAAGLFREGRGRLARTNLDARGWDAVGPGLEKTYKAGRRALTEAHQRPRPRAVHEWRKRAKDGWYHVRLLRGAAPAILEPLEERLHDVSDALGDAHDLAVICDRLHAAPDRFGGAPWSAPPATWRTTVASCSRSGRCTSARGCTPRSQRRTETAWVPTGECGTTWATRSPPPGSPICAPRRTTSTPSTSISYATARARRPSPPVCIRPGPI